MANRELERNGRDRRQVFLGEYTHTLDGKGRVVMPARFRDELSDGCIVLKGQDGQVQVFPSEVWREKAAEVAARPQNRRGRRFMRTFFAGADPQQLDKAGRLLVKPELRTFANLTEGSEVMVLGVYDHVELWSPDAYDSERDLSEEVFMADEEDEPEAI